MIIKRITINLHAGGHLAVVEQQMNSLGNLGLEVDWNLRIERFPYAYPSYSQLMNHAIVTSKYNDMVFINDRTKPKKSELLKIVSLMEDGYACVMLYNVGFMGFSKNLISKIGWWDERFLLGGWEDRDWIFRLKEADLAIYESQEAEYDYSWKSELQVIGHGCRESEPHFKKKWEMNSDKIVRRLPEEKYDHWNLFLKHRNIETYDYNKKWEDSILNIGFSGPNSGPSTSSIIKNRDIQ